MRETLEKRSRWLLRVGLGLGAVGIALAFVLLSLGVPFLVFSVILLSMYAGMDYAVKTIQKATVEEARAQAEAAKDQAS